MHGASRLNIESTSCSDLSHTTRVVRALRPAPITTTLVVPLSECCESRTPPIDFGPRTTLSIVVTSSVTSGVRGPSNTSPPSPSPPTTVGAIPRFVIASIVVGILLVLAGAAFIFFICRRRKQRRNSEIGKGAAMYRYPDYQTVPVNQPRSPPSHSPSNSSVTTEALLDLGLYESDDANEYTYGPVTPPQPQHVEHEMVQIRKATPSPRAVDRRSVDTVFALWFYATTELDRRRSKGSSFLAELPSSTPSPPVPALPTSPPPPTPTSNPDTTKTKRSSKARRTYLTPAGEPWRPGPPPAAPLPPPPPVSAPSTSPAPRKTSNPRFSLFPAPPKPPPKNILKNINSNRSPIPAPLKITPLTNHPLRTQRPEQQQQKQPETRSRAASTGLKSAPLPSDKPLPLSPPLQSQSQAQPHHRPRAQSSQSRLGAGVGLGLQTEDMVDIPLHNPNPNPSPTSRTRPGTSLSTCRFGGGGGRQQQQETTPRPGTSLGTTAPRPQTPGTAPATSTRFNEGLLTPPLGQGAFPPPPGAGHKTRRSLPGTSGSRWFSGFGGWRSPKYIA